MFQNAYATYALLFIIFMKHTFHRLLALAVFLGLLSATALRGDGYKMYCQACKAVAEIKELEAPDVVASLKTVIVDGNAPGTNLVAVIDRLQPVFDTLEKASHETVWNLPDITKASAFSYYTPELAPALRIYSFASVKSLILIRADQYEEALELAATLNTVAQRSSNLSLLPVLGYIASRGRLYPSIVSALQSIPEDRIEEHFVRAKEQYADIPTILDCLEGESHLAVNTTKKLFADLQKRPDIKSAHEQMLKALRNAGLPDAARIEIESGKTLSVAHWESQALADQRSIHTFFTNAVVNMSASELKNLDAEIEKRINNDETADIADILMQWIAFSTNTTAGSFLLVDAEKLHSAVGKSISKTILSIQMPNIGSMALKYRDFIAAERLLLIHYAVRAYTNSQGKAPESLQNLVAAKLLSTEMITDPLSGTSLKSRVVDGEFVVYSVGNDLDDDLGIPWDRRTKSGDIVLKPWPTSTVQ